MLVADVATKSKLVCIQPEKPWFRQVIGRSVVFVTPAKLTDMCWIGVAVEPALLREAIVEADAVRLADRRGR